MKLPSVVRRRPAGEGWLGRKRKLEAWLFIAPLLLFVVIFVFLPVIGTLINAFFRDVAYLEKAFVLFDNFSSLLSDPAFHQVARFTLCFVFVSVPLELAVGLAVALLLHERIPCRGFLRACMLIPWAIPAAVSGRVWELIYNVQYGAANMILEATGLTQAPVNWLGTSFGAFSAIVIADAWKTSPFVAVILMAGLANISRDLYEQAKVDGANALQCFWHVTLPLLRPVLTVVLLFRTIDALRIFDLNYVLTGGGPGGATTSFSLYGYNYLLAGDFGYGSAVSVVLFVAALTISLITIRVGRFERVLEK